MLLYVDTVTGGEVCTDSFKITESHDGAIWNVASKRIAVGGDVQVDVGCGNAFGGGDEEDAPLPAGAETALDIVHYHQLKPMTYGKGEYKALMKRYWKDLKAALEKRKVAAEESKIEDNIKDAKAKKKLYKKQFETLQAFVKTVVGDFSNYDFFVATASQAFDDEHEDKEFADRPTPLIIPASYPDGAVSPVFHIIAAGVAGVKC